MSTHAQSLRIDGPDARAFAQAQFSSNVNLLDVGHWQFSAWLSAQGRVRYLFHLVRLAQDTYLLLLRGGDSATLADELSRFVFRAKLSISAMSSGILATGPALPLNQIEHTGEVLDLGCNTHSLRLGAPVLNDAAWRGLQLHLGWPWLPTSTLGQLLPAALSLQRLAAVVVDKGCYPGQEIVARLHFRGGHKRHLHCGTSSQRLTPGQLLHIDGKEVGVVLDSLSGNAGTEAQFVLNDDVAERLRDATTAHFDEGVAVSISATWPV